MENDRQLVINLFSPEDNEFETNKDVVDEFAPGAPVIDFAEEINNNLLGENYKSVLIDKVASYIKENGPVREILFDGHGSSGSLSIGADPDDSIGADELIQRLHMEIPEGQFPEKIMFNSCHTFELSENRARTLVKTAQDLNIEIVGSTTKVITGLGGDTAGHFYSIKPDGTVERDEAYDNFGGPSPLILSSPQSFFIGDKWVEAFQADPKIANTGEGLRENYTALFNHVANDMGLNHVANDMDSKEVHTMLPDGVSPGMPPEVEALVEVKGSKELFEQSFNEIKESGGLDEVTAYIEGNPPETPMQSPEIIQPTLQQQPLP